MKRIVKLESNFTLRSRLVAILAIALTPILLVAGLQAYLDGKKNLTVRRDALIQEAERSIDVVEQSLSTAEALLEIFSEQIAAGRCADVMEWLTPQLPTLTNVVHFDVNGIAQCSAAGGAGYEMADSHWNDRLREGETLIRTDAFEGKGAPVWMFAILRRLEIRGEFVGSATFGMSASKMVETLNQSKMPEDVHVAISDNDMRIFGDDPGIRLREEWIEEARTSPDGVLFVSRNKSGQSMDVVVSPIGTGGVYAIVSRPSPGLLDNLTLRPAAVVGLPILSFSIALLAVWMAIDGLVLRWLRRLQRLAHAYGGGDYHMRPGVEFGEAPEEISNLANALDAMANSISMRDTDLKQALKQRDDALKEIHHRVKNNLQIVTSFLNLQSRKLRDEEAKAAIAAARHRIDALSVVHQTLYQHEQLEIVQLKPFFSGLLDHLREALGLEELGIDLQYSIDAAPWQADDAIPLALFVVECITNSTKYAFDDEGGHITVELRQVAEGARLIIADDGKGGDAAGAPASNSTGLGRQLKAAFARQLGGKYTVQTGDNEGYVVTLDMPNRAL